MIYQNAVKIIHVEGDVQNAETLLVKKPLQIGLTEPAICKMSGKASIILDFGKELSGGARLLTYAAQGMKTVRLRFGESVGEACAELKGPNGGFGATNDHSNRDMRVELQNYSDMTFGQTGYRFLRIDTLADDTVIKLKTVVAAVDTDTREELGSFECDDPLVNEIWKTAAYTLRLCIQNGYIWDGIKRDRLVWIGDLYPEVRAAHCVFGSIPEAANCLDFSMDQTPLPAPINDIPTYSLWWLICLDEIYCMSSDKSAFAKYLPYAKGIVKEIVSTHVAEDGSVDYGFNFLDWPSNQLPDEADHENKTAERKAGSAFLTKIALTAAKRFFHAFGEDETLCDELLARIAKKDYEIRIYKQIAAVGAWADMSNDTIRETVLAGGAKGLSTFMSYPILTAVAGYGEYEAALSIMKEYYGGMLSVGATTFWEDFDLAWLEGCGRLDEMPKEGVKDIHGDYGKFCYSSFRHSFCHAWSAGVIPYLVETVAGIKMVGADMRRVSITPHLSGLKHVKVNFPTPYGILSVEHTLQEDGSVKTSVSAPEGIEIV
ncbi:MAG: alpha-L-rhamnosidase [Clostridia bacterium]|nr:alpha-L-rhamnosidase [Clostridia bacterium]